MITSLLYLDLGNGGAWLLGFCPREEAPNRVVIPELRFELPPPRLTTIDAAAVRPGKGIIGGTWPPELEFELAAEFKFIFTLECDWAELDEALDCFSLVVELDVVLWFCWVDRLSDEFVFDF